MKNKREMEGQDRKSLKASVSQMRRYLYNLLKKAGEVFGTEYIVPYLLVEFA